MVTSDTVTTANQPPPLRDYNLYEQDAALELLAVVLQGSLLVRHGAPEVADAFCASRLEHPGGVFGTLPAKLDLGAIVERHTPAV